MQAPATDERSAQAVRLALLEELRPVTLTNCTPKRFGSAHDGGYVMCENLIDGVQVAYSYGIGGNDDWGCQVSSQFKVPVHQYDCFNPPAIACDAGRLVPHAECVGPRSETVDARVFDSIPNQLTQNGDAAKRLIVKMDVEGAEWEAILATPDELLARIDQLPIELHGTNAPRFLEAVQKLKRHFYVVHLHFNNWACTSDLPPFPARAYQVLFVNKRLGVVGPPAPDSVAARAFDAPDNPAGPDCQLPLASLMR